MTVDWREFLIEDLQELDVTDELPLPSSSSGISACCSTPLTTNSNITNANINPQNDFFSTTSPVVLEDFFLWKTFVFDNCNTDIASVDATLNCPNTDRSNRDRYFLVFPHLKI